MNIISRALWWGTCGLAWVQRLQCKHPAPKWEGSGLHMHGHLNAIHVSYWHCLKCGKHYEAVDEAENVRRLEQYFHDGAAAYTIGRSLFDNPHRSGMGDPGAFHAWRRGFQAEARRRPRDIK